MKKIMVLAVAFMVAVGFSACSYQGGSESPPEMVDNVKFNDEINSVEQSTAGMTGDVIDMICTNRDDYTAVEITSSTEHETGVMDDDYDEVDFTITSTYYLIKKKTETSGATSELDEAGQENSEDELSAHSGNVVYDAVELEAFLYDELKIRRPGALC